METETTTKEYIRRAIDKYKATKDQLTITMPAGSKDRIKAAAGGKSVNQFVSDLIESALSDTRQSTAAAADKPIVSGINSDLHRITLEIDAQTWDRIRSASDDDIGRWIDAAIRSALQSE